MGARSGSSRGDSFAAAAVAGPSIGAAAAAGPLTGAAAVAGPLAGAAAVAGPLTGAAAVAGPLTGAAAVASPLAGPLIGAAARGAAAGPLVGCGGGGKIRFFLLFDFCVWRRSGRHTQLSRTIPQVHAPRRLMPSRKASLFCVSVWGLTIVSPPMCTYMCTHTHGGSGPTCYGVCGRLARQAPAPSYAKLGQEPHRGQRLMQIQRGLRPDPRARF